jgi:hypothetical protein
MLCFHILHGKSHIDSRARARIVALMSHHALSHASPLRGPIADVAVQLPQRYSDHAVERFYCL